MSPCWESSRDKEPRRMRVLTDGEGKEKRGKISSGEPGKSAAPVPKGRSAAGILDNFSFNFSGNVL